MEKFTPDREKKMVFTKCLPLLVAILFGTGYAAANKSQDLQIHTQDHEQIEPDEHKKHQAMMTSPEQVELNRRYDAAWDEWRNELFGLDIKRGMVVADVGAGEGELSLLVARKVGPEGLVYANEIDTKKLRIISDRAAHSGLQNIVPVLSTSNDPMIPPEQADMVILVEVFHHLSDKKAFLDNTRRRVKDGARLVIIEPDVNQAGGNSEGCYADPATTRTQVEKAGFRVVETRTKSIEGLVFFVLTAAAHS